ncbi:hypothetical protein JCM33774_11390 [Actinophytocola sp. KF-1]
MLDDPADHPLEAQLDGADVVAERVDEHALVAQVVPEPVHGRVLAQGGDHRVDPLAAQLVRRGGGGDDLVVPRDGGRLVLAHAVGDQVDLVAEVVVQDAVGELGVLRDVAEAGARVAEFRERVECRVGELSPPDGELVDMTADRFPLGDLGHGVPSRRPSPGPRPADRGEVYPAIAGAKIMMVVVQPDGGEATTVSDGRRRGSAGVL